MSNFVSSPYASDSQTAKFFSPQPADHFADFSFHAKELVEWSEGAELEENAVQYAEATARLLAGLPIQSRLLLASELKQRGAAARAFAGLLYPGLELSLQWNRVRFYSPQGSYWYSLRRGDQLEEPDWATGFWSLAHWGPGSTSL